MLEWLGVTAFLALGFGALMFWIWAFAGGKEGGGSDWWGMF